MHRSPMTISEALSSFIVELFLVVQFSSEKMTFRSKNNKITPRERLRTVDYGRRVDGNIRPPFHVVSLR